MTAQHNDCEAEILEQAAEWLVRLEEGPLNSSEELLFQHWLAQSPLHQKLWQRAEKLQRKLHHRADYLPDHMAKRFLQAQKPAHPMLFKNLVLLLGITGIIGSGYFVVRTQAWDADYRTAYGEQRQITLADGSVLTLNSKTAIDIDYAQNERAIHLRYGEVYIETGKDRQQRPFHVYGQHGRLLALGTAFAVQQHEKKSTLWVTEHAVRIDTQYSHQQQTLAAGYQVEYDNHKIFNAQPLQTEQLLWRKGLLLANRYSMAQFSAMLTENYGVRVQLDPQQQQQLAKIEISGTFPSNDLNRTLQLLVTTYPVAIERSRFTGTVYISTKK
ncbi:FecR family protein [Acinetobacter larvae]|uniref:Iron dicitrate transport regulator FecR n=1 Tax=Acinetobacter larvae TaxID=1789224 RepID=A0A1B2LVQ5_9GAMM|nr:FecR domain-containing protein [Acinetobacter larvae]AOA57032.1 hypothetical protein BFG52_00775 [Acinetobacter larvae]